VVHTVPEVAVRGRDRQEDAPPLDPVVAAAELLTLPHARDRALRERAGTRRADSCQRGRRLGSEDAIGGDAGVALELLQRRFGVRTEAPVLLADVETEQVELVL